MKRLKGLVPVLLLLAVWPAHVAAQTAGDSSRNVGVVTTLAGDATVTRASLSTPRALRFKDDVFLRDRISTAERSIVRVLLGGRDPVAQEDVVLEAEGPGGRQGGSCHRRELSALTITEDTGRSTIDLSSGKIA